VGRRLFSPLVRGAKVLRPLYVVRKDGLSGNLIERERLIQCRTNPSYGGTAIYAGDMARVEE